MASKKANTKAQAKPSAARPPADAKKPNAAKSGAKAAPEKKASPPQKKSAAEKKASPADARAGSNSKKAAAASKARALVAKAASKNAPAKGALSDKASAKKAPVKSPPVKGTAVDKAPAKKAFAKSAATEKTFVEKASAKAANKKSASEPTPVEKAPAKKASAKGAPAKLDTPAAKKAAKSATVERAFAKPTAAPAKRSTKMPNLIEEDEGAVNEEPSKAARGGKKTLASPRRAEPDRDDPELATEPAPKGRAKKGGAKGARPESGASGAKSNNLHAEDGATNGLAVGDHAPSFVLQDDTGTVVSSESLRGAPYVLYFYPKDDTPGCTLEACGFRDSLPRFSAKGVRILGVSPDLPESHARFKKKYDLSFPLLSDPEKTLAKAYGVWVKKQNYGREYMGVERSTFFVDKSGTVSEVWRGVKVPGHVDTVLDAV